MTAGLATGSRSPCLAPAVSAVIRSARSRARLASLRALALRRFRDYAQRSGGAVASRDRDEEGR